MISTTIRVTNTTSQDLKKFKKSFDAYPDQALEMFRLLTPKRSGNARRRTVLSGDQIEANYPYAQRLEDNWSPQTRGQGILRPFERWARRRIAQIMKGL
jgi:hypothetical protein